MEPVNNLPGCNKQIGYPVAACFKSPDLNIAFLQNIKQRHLYPRL
jgi:hypothetical protein